MMASAGGMCEADDRASRCETAGADQRPNAGREDTTAPEYRRHPPRSYLTCAKHGNPGRVRAAWERFGRSTARNTELSAGNRMSTKRMPVVPETAPSTPGESTVPIDESQQETRGIQGGTSMPSLLHN